MAKPKAVDKKTSITHIYLTEVHLLMVLTEAQKEPLSKSKKAAGRGTKRQPDDADEGGCIDEPGSISEKEQVNKPPPRKRCKFCSSDTEPRHSS